MTASLKPADPILIVDDEAAILLAIDTTLKMSGLNHTLRCQQSTDVLEILRKRSVEVMLLDLTMPQMDGHEVLEAVHTHFPEIPVIVVTGAVDVETAVQCMKAGAFDYVVKPLEQDRLLMAVQRAISFRELRRENSALRHHLLSNTLEHPEAFAHIVTADKKMLSIFSYIESIAATSQPVLIRGETGVGKELIAGCLHALSRRRGDFVAVNVGGLDDNVFSDTLFGHAKGAFTGAQSERRGLVEQALGGTLFLDEIGDLSLASQVKLLRLLQEGEYFPLGRDQAKKADVRIVASTNADLWERQRSGAFRSDLNYRLRTHRIYIPPLRERSGDIGLLVDHFFAQAADQLNIPKPAVPREAVPLLMRYHFPGNVRELQTLVFDALSRRKQGDTTVSVFAAYVEQQLRRESRRPAPLEAGNHGTTEPSGNDCSLICFYDPLPTIKEATRMLVAEAVKRAGGNQTVAAGMLGISQQALSRRLKNMDI
jgi:DNA-binding NtrC family response regulator